MKKRFLREITVDPEGALPENVVQVVQVSRRYLRGIKNYVKQYTTVIMVVVEEDMEP